MKGTKRKHRLLSILLSLMLVAGLVPAMSLTAFAGSSATVTTKEEFANSINGSDISTIVLGADIDLGSVGYRLDGTASKTIDLNGHKLSGDSGGTSHALFYLVDNANLKITDNTASKEGTIEYSPWGGNTTKIVLLHSTSSSTDGYPKLDISAGNFSMGSSTDCSLIHLTKNSNCKTPMVTITGGTFIMKSGESKCITANAGTVNIKNATFSSLGTCIYVIPSNDSINLTVDGSEFTHRIHGISIGNSSSNSITTKISDSKFTHNRFKEDGYAVISGSSSIPVVDCFATGQYGYVDGEPYQYVLKNDGTVDDTRLNIGNGEAKTSTVVIKAGVPDTAITKVEIDPSAITLSKSTTSDFVAKVYGVGGNFNSNVQWSLEGNSSNVTQLQTSLAKTRLKVADDENGNANGKLFVKVTSVADNSKFASAEVRLKHRISIENGKAYTSMGVELTEQVTGPEVNIVADEISGKAFVKWEVASGNVTIDDPNNRRASFCMPAGDIELKAIYKNIYTISFDPNGGSGTMDNIVTDETQYKLPECTFIPPEGKVFKIWSKSTSISGRISNGILNLTGDITVYPIWGNPRLDVTDGTAKDGAGNEVSTNDSNRSVAAGTEITITANAAPEDYAFDKWEVVRGNVTFADATSQVTTFNMPGENVEVKATYKHINHTYGGWESDGTNHWKECTCGYKTEPEAHSYNSVVTAKATTSKNGTVEKECSVCGYRTTDTIYYPKTIKLQATNYTYNGKVNKPSVSIIDANGKTVSSANYNVSYATGRKNVGRYKVTVTFKGDKYSGSKYTYFYINPKGTSISKVSGAKKAFTVKWKKQSSKMATSTITGYQIRYSTSSKMTSAKTKTVKGYKYTSKKITKLSAKKKYYVQVRTYKTVSGKTYYSSWSGVKSVKTK